MSAVRVGVVKEVERDERRVALVPESVGRLTGSGFEVLVEIDAGVAAWFSDDAYSAAGARLVAAEDVAARADVLVSVGRPAEATLSALRDGQVVIGLLWPSTDAELLRDLAARGVTVVSLDRLPRTLSRAQTMDALTSQANLSGYKAVLVAATEFGRYFPLLTTAAGTAPPARTLVLGVGVAGLQAIATARRLGAVVTAYDIRPAAREEARSLGAGVLGVEAISDGAGEGGYARTLTAAEQRALRDELAAHLGRYDVVITSAQLPGRTPPVLVTADAVKQMAAGSVIVDAASSEYGGNVEESRPGETVVTDNGVTIVGASNLPATMPTAASTAYSRNIAALLRHLAPDGGVVIDCTDEIQAAIVRAHGGEVIA